MKAKLTIAISALIILVACGKDKFQTKPLIEVRDYNKKTVSRTDGLTELRITLNYYDKQGDLGSADFFAVRQRLNVKPLPPANDKADTLRYSLPKFPNTDHGEIRFEIGYDFLKESPTENDTINFRIAVKDLAGNKSDTITTAQLVILK